MSNEREENPLVHEKLQELRDAEGWLEWKASSFANRHFQGTDVAVDGVSRKLFELLRVAYLEGYSDRMKSEIKELRTPEPKRRTRRKK